jgi:hypothetical protein
MNSHCQLMGFVTTVAGRRLLEASREAAARIGGRVVVTAACGLDKTRPALCGRVCRMLSRHHAAGLITCSS